MFFFGGETGENPVVVLRVCFKGLTKMGNGGKNGVKKEGENKKIYFFKKYIDFFKVIDIMIS